MSTTTPDIETQFDRALAADRRLRPIVRIVDALCALVGAEDEMCAGCIWTGIVKPLVTPLLGWGRGYAPTEATDPDPGESSWLPRRWSMAELMAEPDHRTPATTDTEKWLRSPEAYDAFTDVLLERLREADPANGHGIRRTEAF
jgi:hypothetical protein